MVAKTPLKEKRLAMALDPNLVREAVKKVDKCMARLQELQYTITGGTKVISGVSLSTRSTRAYLRTSLRCKQESSRLRKSPAGKFPGNFNGEWQRMSIPARLLDETVGEILQASQFTKQIASKISNSRTTATLDPKTPDPIKKRPLCENTQLRARRNKEKSIRFDLNSPSPSLPRARSRIAFKSNSPLKRNTRPILVSAQKVSPKTRPWAKKTVLFPNPVFSSTSNSSPKKFYRTRSPIIARTITMHQKTPHKFLIKSPPTSLKSKMKSSKALPMPIMFSPVQKKLASGSKARRCSFSPSKLAKRLVSPLRRSSSGLMSGLKQRPDLNRPMRMISSIGRM